MAFGRRWDGGLGAGPLDGARTASESVGKLSAVYAWFQAVAVMGTFAGGK
jgi:hypothetical protein